MGLKELKRIGLSFFSSSNKNELIRTINELRNMIEDLHKENKELKEEVHKLKDEINRLKGEKGRPNIKANSDSQTDVQGQNQQKGEKKKWKKSEKKRKIRITRRERLNVRKEDLPEDAEYKGTREVIVQDVKIEPDNIAFEIERYYSKKEGQTYEASLPEAYRGGEFGPGIRALILLLHYQGRMPQKLLHTLLTDMSILISEGEICRIINKSGDCFPEEMELAREAAISKQGFQQIDDTGARINGKNGYTIATCNEYFTSYETGFKKNRLSALAAIAGGKELLFLINEFAIEYLKEKLPGKAISRQLYKLKSDKVYNEIEFTDNILDNPEITKYGKYTIRYLKEACAIAAYKANYLGVAIEKLVCDDAPQFKGLTEYLQLCWIHEGRHYKKLEPFIDDHRKILDDFMRKFWSYYENLKSYKKQSAHQTKQKLWDEFDATFFADTNYFALNRIIEKTKMKKDALLLVLEFPEIPLHNNECELDVREKVVQRKIRNCYRSTMGAKNSDIFLGLMATCRKNGISFYKYLTDRIYKIFEIPPIHSIITQTN